jgi:hypothetical protein
VVRGKLAATHKGDRRREAITENYEASQLAAFASRHEGKPLEQMHILFVFDERAV